MLKPYNSFYIFIVLIIICFIVYLFNIYRDTEEKFIAILEIDHSTTPFLTSPSPSPIPFYLSYITDAYIEDQVGVTESVLTGKNTFKQTLQIDLSLDNVIATFPINDNSIFVLNKSFELYHIGTISPILPSVTPSVTPSVNFDVNLSKKLITTTTTTSYLIDSEKILKIIYDESSTKLYILTNLGNIVIILLDNLISTTTVTPLTKLTNVSAVDIFLFGPNKVGFLNNNGEIKFYEITVTLPITQPDDYTSIISASETETEPKIIKVTCNNEDGTSLPKKIVVYIDTVKTSTGVNNALKYVICETNNCSSVSHQIPLTPTPSYNISSPGKCRLLLRDNIFVLIDSNGNLFCYIFNLVDAGINLLSFTPSLNSETIKFLDAIFVKVTTGTTEINYLITKVKNTISTQTPNSHTQTHTHTDTPTHIQQHTHTHQHAHTHTQTDTLTHTHTNTPTHRHTQTHAHQTLTYTHTKSDTYELRIFKFDELHSHVSTITGINHNTFFCGSHINRLFILDSDEIVSDCQKCSLTEHDFKTNECMCAGFENLSAEEDIMCREISTSILELAKTEITLLLSM
jgi:hypothetical protein